MLASTEKQRILYMEDNATAARLFQIKLGNEGFLVDIARDGRRGDRHGAKKAL